MTMKDNVSAASSTSKTSAPGPWEASALAQLREWDPAWAQAAERVTETPGSTTFYRERRWNWSVWPSTPPARISIPKAPDGISAEHSMPGRAVRRF